VLFESAVGYLNVYFEKKEVFLRQHFNNIPTVLGRWESIFERPPMSAELVEELGTKDYFDRFYAPDGDPRKGWINVHVAYYTGMIDAVPHIPDRCFVAGGYHAETRPRNYPLPLDRSGWEERGDLINQAKGLPYPIVRYPHPITPSRLVTVHLPVGDFELRVIEFSDAQNPSLRIFGGYFFIANGGITATPEGVKQLAFRKSEEYAYYCKVQFYTVEDDLRPEQFVERVADLLDPLLPELMNCLPDWPEIEARRAAGSAAGDRATIAG
jgi:hypothetical protein